MKIELITNQNSLVNPGTHYFWTCWGNESNFDFYKDCIENSLLDETQLPKFYVLLDEENIVGSYALLVNDLISRQDILPWFACLFVNDSYRNQGWAGKLLTHALQEAYQLGFDSLYLSTDLAGFYERKGWQFYAFGYGIMGNRIKIYRAETGEYPLSNECII